MLKKILRKQQRNGGKAAEQIADKAAGKIVATIAFIQNRFSNFLNRKTKNFSVNAWKVLIVFFALTWGGVSIYLIATALTTHATMKINKAKILMIKARKTDSLQLIEEIYNQQKDKPNK